MASVFTPDQVSAFLSHIQLPPKYRPENNPPHDLALLTALHTHTITTLPYENLSLHYSPTHQISIFPQTTFQKTVTDARGRGGYCMEVSLLFNHILRALGFTVYTAGVRIRMRKDGIPHGNYIGWVHLVNIVTLATGEKYMLDVGFGGDGATRPVPMVDGEIVNNLGAQQIRLVRDWIPNQARRTEESKLWVYQYRNGEERDWNSFYAFPEFEFLEPDYEIMNWFTGANPGSHQTYTVIVIRFLYREGERGEREVCGKRMLVGDVVKENLGGRTRVVHVCESESERVEWLETFFGIRLSEGEKEGIRGWRTELGAGREAD
ncbi:arylamine N-acetyltransferase 1 [Dendryphion nanum]|uniref:Arylamine N-acetyltransferase 1 n=1 Tax=Dendryphion nanum TaxID=256645 RepID=A0A9P9E794_9PLEO|nr:arylamine N-acetyltransferase 1 [Dendryphion nanum]